MTGFSFSRFFGCLWITVALTLTTACSALRPKETPPPSYYTLDRAVPEASTAAGGAAMVSPTDLVLIVDPPHAAAGFDSSRIVYTRGEHRFEYFAHSEWVDTPARMLPPLMASAIARAGVVRAVVLAPSSARGDLRLDTEIIMLVQDFAVQPSQVRFTLRATIVDDSTHKVIAGNEFDQTVAASTDDPFGGVVAANIAVTRALNALAKFCGEAAQTWQRSRPIPSALLPDSPRR